MCGIFGYVGKQNNAAQTVLDGLKLLEYRGYDSWGIAAKPCHPELVSGSSLKKGKMPKLVRHDNFIIEKHIGKIGNAVLSSKFSVLSSLSIGHSRWATHGGVTELNAHPHLDCTKTIAVVHNGIIENFAELKKELIAKGHKFISETDTEVIPHLIEEYLKKEGFASSVRDTFNRLAGMNAIVVASALSSEIIAAKNGSPLVVGVGENELFIASDAAGIVKHTKKVVFLEDNQMAILGNGLKLIKLPKGEEIKAEVTQLNWKFEDSVKGKYPHFLLKEINEEPKVLENIAFNYLVETKTLANLIDKAFVTFMLGCGTASYAALAGTYLFSSIAKKHVNFVVGSEFKYQEQYLTPKTLVIPISQSGETIDVVDPVKKAKQKGCQIAALVNVLGSTLYRQADHKVLLGAGQEKAVIATKSFMAMFSILLMTAYTLVGKQKEGCNLLLAAAKDIEKLLKTQNIAKIKILAKKLKTKEHIYIIGRGLSYATSLEAALKIKETGFTHAEGFAGGELKHGVIALIEKGTPCIVFAPNDETYEEIISNAQEVRARGGFIIGIGPKENPVFDTFFETADIKEATLLPQILIMQLLGYYLALAKGIKDPDKPRNLAKSVTVK
ncbi:MAG TPA: glutamine--fructose-6-phosphate transaminase (isomerizing) [Patescibacteria group bacterium]|nr:glutamine--fructose-6-phosphate transaminase (isomerizing) [Patescibacteria group bacterium]